MNTGDWRRFDAYLFDIDGTLLTCADAVHYFAFCHVLSTVAGRALDLTGVTAHGNVDTGILRDAFAVAGVPEAVWRPQLATMVTTMGSYCTERAGELRIEVAPGARQALEMLRDRGARLGVATGNLRSIGELKLKTAGLLQFFDFAAWSDGCEHRHDVFARGMHLAQAAASMLVVGDTPADIRAAKANGLPVLAVASGVYRNEDLAAEGPDWCFASLEAAMQSNA